MRATTLNTSMKLLVVIAVVTVLAGVAAASNINGAIFTTTSTGTTVNGNIYNSKADVYLNGGPQNSNGGGLVPDGTYYFQVTDPSGALLLSLDDISCRQVVVAGGKITGVPTTPPPAACLDGYHNLGTFNSANGEQPIQLCNPNASKCATDFADTTNPGGEYKVWLTLTTSYSPGTCTTGRDSFGFCDSASKTDNFKVKLPGVANITVCKFQACTVTDDDGTCGGTTTDPLLSGWTIDATGADQLSQVTAGSGGATPFGCATFTVSKFTAGSATVGLTEVLQTGWTQTAPDSNTPGSAQCSPTGTIGSPAGETCTVGPGDNIAAENFGNVMGAAGVAPTVVKTANGSYNTAYTWTVAKSVDKTQVYTAGGGPVTVNYTVTVTHDGGTISNVQVTGDITVTNPNPFTITLDSVTDQLSSGENCTVNVTGGLTIPASTSTVTGSSDFPYSCTLSGGVPTGEEDNTALITWSDQSGTLNGVPWTLKGNSAPFTFPNIFFANGPIDGSVTVTDTLDGVTSTLGTVASTDTSPTLFTFPETFSDKAGTCTTHTNTASIKTSTGNVTTTTDPVTVTDCQGADLTISKSATPSYTFGITKTPKQTSPVESSGSTTLSYTIVVTESGWQVLGSINVTNPNDWEDVTVSLSDTLTGFNCTYPPSVVAARAISGVPTTTSVNYSCTPTGVPGASGTNNVTGTWSGASTPHTSASNSAGYAFATLTVTDIFNSGSTKTLGTITVPTASTTYTDSYTVTPPAGTCTVYPNTATATENTVPPVVKTASASVTVCNTKTNALTMGFWQNNNGQALIKGAGPTSGTCSLVPYLTSYVPFQDLSLTATCSSTQTASKNNYTLSVTNYVTYIISLANSSGGGTAMTKGQMLATALTAYFSSTTGNSCGFTLSTGLSGTGFNYVASQGTISNLACVNIQLNPINGKLNVGIAFNGIATGSDTQHVYEMLLDTSAKWTALIACTNSSCKSNAVLTSSAYTYINQSQANIAP